MEAGRVTELLPDDAPEDAGPPEDELDALTDQNPFHVVTSDEGSDFADWPVEDEAPPDAECSFVTLREFQGNTFPPSESLMGVGRAGTNLLPRTGWVMPWGPEGSGKTSIVDDLVMHAAAGREWVGYPTSRPLRFVLVANEGVPGGLQDKLAEKLETWDGDTRPILDGIALYRSPWGEFTLQNKRMLHHLRDFARDFGADYAGLDPLHTVGTVGAGAPKETEEFKHLLRELGLWKSLGVITVHHSNKAGMISGDWGRHPDTLIRLEKDGARPATKYTLQKARPADPLELNVVQTLEWITETRSYHRVQVAATPKAVGAQNRSNVLDAVTEGLTTVAEIATRTGLSDRTVTAHLKKLAEGRQLTLDEGAKGKLIVAHTGDKTEADNA